ncbi:MAG: hypothetical protein KDF65_09325, partial [Anaerolineae bacterium]|nr:hypothetical protein [Anaerolineae bacterium]
MMTDPKTFLRKLKKNLNILKEREAKYGRNAPLELLNQIEDHERATALTEQLLASELTDVEWAEALKPLLVSLEKVQVVIDQPQQQVDTQYNVAGNVIIYNYPQPPPPPMAAEDRAADEPIPA